MDEVGLLNMASLATGKVGGGKRIQEALTALRDTPARREVGAIAFMMAYAAEAKGQLFQDLWALWVSGLKSGGYFVEFGAASGVELSNSWLLEKKMGWRGILAEPNPVFWDSLKANRTCDVSTKCVFDRSGEQLEFLASHMPELSRIASLPAEDSHERRRLKRPQVITVETISLNDLLIERGAPAVIDYLSLDTEGSELRILEAFDFDRWDVRAITVEHNFTPLREALHDFLSERGYRRELEGVSLFDDWYVKVG